jgi:hypothetical protein
MIAAREEAFSREQEENLSKPTKATCSDCYFRRAGLCALPGETPCPTFRAFATGRLVPPPQPRLVARPLAAAHAAA